MPEYSRRPVEVVDERGSAIRTAVIDPPITPFKFPPGSEAILKDSDFVPGVPYRAKSIEGIGEDVAVTVGTRLKVRGVKNDGGDRICDILDGPGAGRRIQVSLSHLR